MICSIVIRKLKLKWGDYMWLSGGADEKAKARARRKRVRAIKRVLLVLGYSLFAIGLGELGISVKTAEWWCLMLGLALYVTFND